MGMKRNLQILMGVPEALRLRDLSPTVRAKLTSGRMEWHQGESCPGAPIIVAGFRLVHMVTDFSAQQVNDFLGEHQELGMVPGYAANLYPRASGFPGDPDVQSA